MHLTSDELLDLAEGVRAETTAPHLAACARCRLQLADLRATMSAVADVEVPEPSPFFWAQFSRRVHDAVAAETIAPAASVIPRLLASRAVQASIFAFASLVAVVFVTAYRHVPPAIDSGPPQVARVDRFTDRPIESDASLLFVATLAANADADLMADAGLGSVGSADHAVTHMNDAELRELHRLLQEEMTP